MRKIFVSFALLFVLSISIFAEGDMSLGGRTCPPPEPNQPPPACAEPTPPPPTAQSSTTSTGSDSANDETDEPNVLGEVIDYLGSLFG